MITANRLVDYVSVEIANSNDPLLAYWHHVSSTQSRDELAGDIAALRGCEPVAAVVLRDARLFQSPNAVAADVMALVDSNRELIEPVARAQSRAAVVILARSGFDLPQVSSPASLPLWFPGHSGELVLVGVVSTAVAVTAGMNANEARMHELQELLHACELALTRRLRIVALNEPAAGQALFIRIRTKAEEPDDWVKFITSAEEHLMGIRNASAYRPSASSCNSVLARLLRRRTTDTSLDIDKVAADMAAALKLCKCDDSPDDSILAALWFSVTQRHTEEHRVVRNIVSTMFGAHQFSNCAAHADNYPEYCVELLQYISHNLRSTLQSCIAYLSGLPT